MKAEYLSRALIVFVVIFLSCLTSLLASADRVKLIRPDGSLVLEDGDHVVLTGIELSPEAHRILPILVAEKDVKIDLDPYIKKQRLGGPMSVYLYLETEEIKAPYDPASEPRQKKIMLNKLLITMGAARVQEGLDFRLKDEFMDLQIEAKIRGQGIWSYESIFDPDAPSEADPIKRLNTRLDLWEKSEDDPQPEAENRDPQDEWSEL